MGLKGCRLWVMGQLYSNVQSPTAGISANSPPRLTRAVGARPACSAAAV
jgi:hypothetical protein